MPLMFDCESRERTRESVSACFRCSSHVLDDFLADPNTAALYELHWETLPSFDRWLYRLACERFGAPNLPLELCWFHGTRAPQGTSFSEGLLPLGHQLPRLLDSLLATLEAGREIEEVKRAFERKGGYGFHFSEKLRNPLHWGPFAFLVREVATSARRLGQHDYLAMPEIIEDLCEDISMASGLDILPVFEKRWLPAIVKFKAPAKDSAPFALAVALCYLRSCQLEGGPDRNSVWCFDGKNEGIPRQDILKVEWVT